MNLLEKQRLLKRNNEISKLVKEGKIQPREKLTLLKEKRENRELMGLGKKPPELEPVLPVPGENTNTNPLPDQFAGGEFNHLSPLAFMRKIDEADEAGATIEQLRLGCESWMTANEALKAA